MTTDNHSPLPWNTNGVTIFDADMHVIAAIDERWDRGDAEFITDAVNYHEELINLLKRCYIILEGREPITSEIRSLIAQAEGK